MKKTLALFLCLLPLAAWSIPTDIAAEYKLTFGGVTIGTVNESFVRTGDSYAIQSVTRSEGPLKIFLDDQLFLESSGKVVAGGLQPHVFAQRRAKKPQATIRATFDWDHGVMHSTSDDGAKDVPLPKRTQDRISVMYQFMNLAPGAESATVSMHMSNGRKVELYTYRLVDEVRVSTPAGDFDTLHYERVVDSPKDSKAQVWLAKDHFNFPVRVVFDDPKGLRVEQTLTGLRAR